MLTPPPGISPCDRLPPQALAQLKTRSAAPATSSGWVRGGAAAAVGATRGAMRWRFKRMRGGATSRPHLYRGGGGGTSKD